MKNGLVKKAIIGAGIVFSSLFPMKNIYSQPASITKGVSFGINKIGGEEYKKELTIVHGTPYVISEVKPSKENTLGVEASPYLMEKAGKKVVYVPQEMNVERIGLKQDGPFGIKGDKKDFTFDYFIDNKNPMGEAFDHIEKDYSGNIATMILPSGDTTYFFYNTTNKNAINKGDELNFITALGDSIKSDDKGSLYIQNNETNKFYKWVKDETRSTAPTSIDKKVIDTTYFSVIKSNKEIPDLKNYESKVDSGQYETVISGTQDKELKYTVVRSPTKLKSLDNNIEFKRTYCQSNGNYIYTIESDKIKIENVKDRKDLVAINGTNFKKKAVSTESKKVEVPFYNKITSKGTIHEYVVPVEDLKKLKIVCDSCGTSSKYQIDTTNVTESLVLNPNYPFKYLDKFGTYTTGEVDTIILSDRPLEKEKKIKKETRTPLELRLKTGVSGVITKGDKYEINPEFEINPQIMTGENSALGVYFTAGNSTKTSEYSEAGTTNRVLVNLPTNMYYVNNTGALNDKTTLSNNFGFGVNYSYIAPSWEAGVKVGLVDEKLKREIQESGSEYMEINGAIDPTSIQSYDASNTIETNKPLFKGSPLYLALTGEYRPFKGKNLKNISIAGEAGYIMGDNSHSIGKLGIKYTFGGN